MIKKIDRILIMSVMPIAAAISFAIGIFNSVMVQVAFMASSAPIKELVMNGPLSMTFNSHPGIWFLIGWPFISAFFGALIAAVVAFIYNFLARLVGPVKLSLSDA